MLDTFEQLWDEASLRAEVEDFFKEFDDSKWSLDGGMNKPFREHLEAGLPTVDFYRDAEGYIYQSAWNCATNDERSKYIAIRDFAISHGYTSAIDIGCGIGSGVVTLALAGLEKVVGVDICKPNLKFLEARAKRFGLDNIKTVDIYPDKFTRHKADLVICTEVFEHVDDPIEFAKKIHGLIKPGGAMIASWSFVDMVGHLPQHFHLAARHPDTWQTEGFGLILINEVGFKFDSWTWFNNTAWMKVDAPEVVEEVVEVVADEDEEIEEIVEEVAEEELVEIVEIEGEKVEKDAVGGSAMTAREIILEEPEEYDEEDDDEGEELDEDTEE